MPVWGRLFEESLKDEAPYSPRHPVRVQALAEYLHTLETSPGRRMMPHSGSEAGP